MSDVLIELSMRCNVDGIDRSCSQRMCCIMCVCPESKVVMNARIRHLGLHI
jgi:hypothetical protein